MSINSSNIRSHAIVFGVGAVGGMVLFAWASSAIPKMASRMMQNMMARMQEHGCDPKEM